MVLSPRKIITSSSHFLQSIYLSGTSTAIKNWLIFVDRYHKVGEKLSLTLPSLNSNYTSILKPYYPNLEPSSDVTMTFLNQLRLFLAPLVNQPILPDIMQSLALGLVTVTIASAIFLVGRGTNVEFDRVVILKKVIGKSFLYYFLLLFVPLFFWSLSGSAFKFLLFLFYLVGVGGYLGFLVHSYRWIREIETEDKRKEKGYRQKMRLEFLEEVIGTPQGELAWEFVWQLEDKSLQEESTYVERFVENINSLLKQGKAENTYNLISLFKESIDNLSLNSSVIFEDVFKAILEWHYEIQPYRQPDNKETLQYKRLLVILNPFIRQVLEKGLGYNENHYFVFNTFEDFVSKCEEKYKERLMSNVATTFFENIAESPEGRNIWSDYFPEKWKVTKETFTDSQNLMANLWLTHFLKWAEQRIQKQFGKEFELDKQLGEITKGLFPSVDPMIWSQILTFLMRPWGKEGRMKSFVENTRSFGHISVGPISYGDESKVQEVLQEKKKRAKELALIIFKGEFSEKKLNEYINELEKLSFEEESLQNKKVQIKNIFEDMLNLLEEEKNEQN